MNVTRGNTAKNVTNITKIAQTTHLTHLVWLPPILTLVTCPDLPLTVVNPLLDFVNELLIKRIMTLKRSKITATT